MTVAEPTMSGVRRRACDVGVTGTRILVRMSALVIGIDSTDWSSFGHVLAKKSAALVALVVFALVLQWIFHRLIDKLVSKAEDGVLPDRIAQVAIGRTNHEVGTPAPGSTRRVQRARTMGTLLKSIVS